MQCCGFLQNRCHCNPPSNLSLGTPSPQKIGLGRLGNSLSEFRVRIVVKVRVVVCVGIGVRVWVGLGFELELVLGGECSVLFPSTSCNEIHAQYIFFF